MVRNFKKWVGIQTTYTIGDKVYPGRVVNIHYLNPQRNGKNGDNYSFLTDLGRSIRITPKNIKVKDGGLVLKLSS